MIIWPVQADAQGLFEAIFGPSSGPRLQYAARQEAPGMRTDHHIEPATVFRNVRHSADATRQQVRRHVETAKPGPYVPPKEMPGKLGRFLHDPTLRAGDVVATDQGLMVYRGPGGARHNEKQFVSVGTGSGVVGDKLPLLLAMDREARRSPAVTTDAPRRRALPIVASN